MRANSERPLARAMALARDPYHVERALGVILWIALFAVLVGLSE